MSWAEVKLLTDGHNEILEKVDDVYSVIGSDNPNVLISTGFHETNFNSPVLNVTGKGKLYFAILGGHTTNSEGLTIRVTVDGTVIANVTAYTTTTAVPYAKCGILNPNFMYGVYEDSGYFYYIIPAEHSTTNNSNYRIQLYSEKDTGYVKYLQFSNTLQTVSSTTANGVSALFLVDAPITFNKSLKIECECKVSGQRNAYTIGYKLDE